MHFSSEEENKCRYWLTSRIEANAETKKLNINGGFKDYDFIAFSNESEPLTPNTNPTDKRFSASVSRNSGEGASVMTLVQRQT